MLEDYHSMLYVNTLFIFVGTRLTSEENQCFIKSSIDADVTRDPNAAKKKKKKKKKKKRLG